MQSLRAERLEEGALFELLQTERGTHIERGRTKVQHRKGFLQSKGRQFQAPGSYVVSVVFYFRE